MGISSVNPPTKYLTFGVWIYLVPQYRPRDILVLGYGGGTVAGLVRMLYGDVPITGVDVAECPDEHRAEIVRADAREFVKDCREYDCVVVDLFDGDDIRDFALSREFADHLARIGSYVILNTAGTADVSAYSGMELVMSIGIFGNRVYYFKPKGKEIPEVTPPL